jgi:hypothetical protein
LLVFLGKLRFSMMPISGRWIASHPAARLP